MKSYFLDRDNLMFIIEYEGLPIGCMGYRRKAGGFDVYNVILGRKEYSGSGLMGKALKMMCSHMRKAGDDRIYLKVLKTNMKARRWYEKNGFVTAGIMKDAYLMEFAGTDVNSELIEVTEKETET